MDIMCAREVSELTGVPLGTLRYWRHADLGPASFTLGRRVVYRRSEVERWIAEQEAATRRGGGDAA
jgi:predicted DNA-binding transcriptional regulator AlpA